MPQTPQTTVTLPYTSAQTAGDLNVAVVGWNETTAQGQHADVTRRETSIRWLWVQRY